MAHTTKGTKVNFLGRIEHTATGDFPVGSGHIIIRSLGDGAEYHWHPALGDDENIIGRFGLRKGVEIAVDAFAYTVNGYASLRRVRFSANGRNFRGPKFHWAHGWPIS